MAWLSGLLPVFMKPGGDGRAAIAIALLLFPIIKNYISLESYVPSPLKKPSFIHVNCIERHYL